MDDVCGIRPDDACVYQPLLDQPQGFVAAAAVGKKQLADGRSRALFAGLKVGLEASGARAEDELGFGQPPGGDFQRRLGALLLVLLQIDGDVERLAALFLAAQVIVRGIGAGDAQSQGRLDAKGLFVGRFDHVRRGGTATVEGG